MYCVNVNELRETNNIERVVTKNNRNMLRGKCDVCGSTKTQFIKADVGKGVVNKLINNLPFEAHLPGHNFTGPGTKLNRRLNEDLTPKPWSIPINRVGRFCLSVMIYVMRRTEMQRLEMKCVIRRCLVN